MLLNIEGLEIVFPFDTVYKEQMDLMFHVKRALDNKGHAVIECPTGTGKTISLLSVIVAYQKANPKSTAKFIYCTRTVPEMNKCIEELKLLMEVRNDPVPTMAVCLSSRKNMCINQKVLDSKLGVDVACRKKTATWVRKRVDLIGEEEEEDCLVAGGGEEEDGDEKLCSFFEEFVGDGAGAGMEEGESMENNSNGKPKGQKVPTNVFNVPRNVYTLDDMKDLGKQRGWCPYFMARHCLQVADVIVYNFQYLLDPKVSNLVSKSLTKDCIVVFDESHNVDNVCIECLSVNFNRTSIDTCLNRLGNLSRRVDRLKQTNVDLLTQEYNALVQGMQQQQQQDETGELLATPVALSSLPPSVMTEEIKNQAIPGNIRKAEHFLQLVTQLVVFLKQRMDESQRVSIETTTQILHQMETKLSIDPKTLKFCHSRLESLMQTLRVVNLEFYNTVSQMCDFLTLLSSYRDGFCIVIEPFDAREKEFRNPILQLACLDASIAIKPVFSRFDSVIIISGTLSPLDLYPKLLDFQPKVSVSLPMSISRNLIFPVVVSRGSDQSAVTSEFAYRDDPNTNRNYGQLLIEIASTVPDGVVGFFTSYELLEHTISDWDQSGILQRILEHKLIFVETKDVVETSLSLDAYRRACDSGRGAVFLSVARGKVSEGIDFAHHYGRAVVLFGIPFQYTKSVTLLQRLEFLHRKFNIKERDFLTFDAVRSASQCLGRVLRSKQDWGIMVLADRRFSNEDKRNKLPKWIQGFIQPDNLNLSIDEAVAKIRLFLREIAQPVLVSTTRNDALKQDEAQAWEGKRVESEKKRAREENAETWE
ncbi:hypothetical protein BASA81_001782 [Batrachochytrium salamandrivorans]|nr:hypothetical protein BASA81_001782 [Batrachochytrium salamandrivorans]